MKKSKPFTGWQPLHRLAKQVVAGLLDDPWINQWAKFG